MPLLTSHISKTRAEGRCYAERIRGEEFCVSSDGSCYPYYHGGVGGAARAETAGGTIILKEHLGLFPEHRAVEGEIVGVILALGIIKTIPFLTSATILLDCQQAIRELVGGKSHHPLLLDRFQEELRTMDKRLSRIRLAWVPGHDGIEMNKLVDKDAKAAALGDSMSVYR
ncbi:hypothetical protein DFH07DRAFT_850315 [Mycena maculata]|uniref:RNase H type-1 domain-containing protein n=1 Tax=Mycena maculata TaxID=230809 RepID=A0AAD7MSX7_9AGAR|nr:hypothetical protein DFH07DRAFT_850315 [Mycena maculata]